MSTQGVRLEARQITVCRKGKLILQDVSFTAEPGTLTAIIGPNGAGKTTLMRALSGERPDAGQVLIDGQDFYADPEIWLHRIGYVPVDNVLHDHLTLWEAMVFVGLLRLPENHRSEIEPKVDALLSEFDFPADGDRRHQPIRLLSSGERKRANICAELIMDPPLLMLDEPTSNLDPNAERDLMRRLADYAHNHGQTILVITHTLNTIDICDRVLFIENARLREDGERNEVLNSLEQTLQDQTATESSLFYRWASIFEFYRTDETKRERCTLIQGVDNKQAESSIGSGLSQSASWEFHLSCLLRRYLRVRLGDKWSFIGTLLAGLSGILFFILPGSTFMTPRDPSEIGLALNQARQSVYVVAIIVTLIGLITSYTEISKEFRIYRHERLKGLSVPAYFLSKWIWLVMAIGVLAPIFLLLFIVLVYGQPLPGFPEPRIGEEVGWIERLWRFQIVGLVTQRSSWLILITLVLACISSITLGLFVSALAGDSDKGYLYLSFVVVFIVLFSGLIHNDKLESLVETLSFLSTGRWAFEGFASSISLYCWLDSWRFEEFNSTGHIVSVWLALVAFTVLLASASIVVLRLRDPWYRQRTNLMHLFTRNLPQWSIILATVLILFSYTQFLRAQSRAYHELNYWSRQEYGGTNAYIFANIKKVQDRSTLQYWNGQISQSWCGDR